MQIKDSTASSHSTSVTIMCEVHGRISPEDKTFSEKKKIYFKITNVPKRLL